LGFFNYIRRKVAEMASKAGASQEREVVPVSFSPGKTCAILYRAYDEEESELIRKFVKYLRDYKLTVLALGYYDTPKMPEGVNPKLEFDYFTKKDLNLLMQPGGKTVANFIEEPYDILIDTSMEPFFPFKYIVSHSNAKFRVGRQELEYSNLFDMMIKVEEGKDLKYLLRHIDHYLNIINKETI
jgi:hypothetical protein